MAKQAKAAARKTRPAAKKARLAAKAKKRPPADKQRKNSGKSSKNTRFQKGNPFAFKPGQSGNPKGRPRSRVLSEALREMLQQSLPNDPSRSFADAIAEMLCFRAMAGDVNAIKEIADRTEGKPRQAVDLSLDERKHQMVENAIRRLMEATGISREEAIEELTGIEPEISKWIN